MSTTMNRFGFSLLLLGIVLFLSPRCCADIVVDFDGLSGTTTIPPTFTSSTSPISFDVAQHSGPTGSIQLDNAGHGGTGTDFELRMFWSSGATTVTSFKRTDGGIFDFTSFDFEAQAGGNTAFQVQAYLAGGLTGNQSIGDGDLGTHDFSGNASFKDIDELRVVIALSTSQNVLDNFTFNAVPEPSSFLLLGGLGLLTCLRPRYRRD